MDWGIAWERVMRATVCRALGHRLTKRVYDGEFVFPLSLLRALVTEDQVAGLVMTAIVFASLTAAVLNRCR